MLSRLVGAFGRIKVLNRFDFTTTNPISNRATTTCRFYGANKIGTKPKMDQAAGDTQNEGKKPLPSKITVIGGGQMGSGIALTAASKNSKLEVQIICEHEKSAIICKSFIDAWLEKDLNKNKLTQKEKFEVLKRISFGLDLADARGAEFIIEAVPENLELKKQIFENLGRMCSKDSVLATNTANLSVSALAQKVTAPERVVGMRFFNPVPIMGLVEIVRAVQTGEDTLDLARRLASDILGKEPIDCLDSPGFISSRIVMPWINEAVICLQDGVGTIHDIDQAMRVGCNSSLLMMHSAFGTTYLG
jgi:3-hydroxybutyryl-CoA dehydrogenase